MISKLKTIAVYVLIGITFWLMIYHLLNNWQEVSKLQVWTHPWMLTTHFLLMIFVFLGLTLGWHIALISTGCAPRLFESAYTWLTPNLGKYLPGKILMFAGRVELGRRVGIRRVSSLTAMTLEHVIIALATLPFLALAFSKGLWVKMDNWDGLSIPIMIAVIIIFVFAICATNGLSPTFNRLNLPPISHVFSLPRMAFTLLVYTVILLVYGLSGVVLVRASESADIPMFHVIIAWVSAWAIGFFAIFSPGGLGIREAALTLMLKPWMPTSQAIALALLSRVTWTLVELLGVFTGIWLGRRYASHFTSFSQARAKDV